MQSKRKGLLCNLRITHSKISLHKLIRAFVARLQNQWLPQYMLTSKECSDQAARMLMLSWTFASLYDMRALFPRCATLIFCLMVRWHKGPLESYRIYCGKIYRIRLNYRTYPMNAQSSNSVVFRLQPVYFLSTSLLRHMLWVPIRIASTCRCNSNE